MQIGKSAVKSGGMSNATRDVPDTTRRSSAARDAAISVTSKIFEPRSASMNADRKIGGEIGRDVERHPRRPRHHETLERRARRRNIGDVEDLRTAQRVDECRSENRRGNRAGCRTPPATSPTPRDARAPRATPQYR